MTDNLAKQILRKHLVSGRLLAGEEIGIRAAQTLTQDGTGVLTYLQFESLGLDTLKTELSVGYVDHNIFQNESEVADIHQFLQTFAAKYGIVHSRPGNGICHQVHLERFAVPGKVLLGTDSHTPTCGAMGMIAIGAGGLDVAVAMAGNPFYMIMPKIVKVDLRGKLKPWVSAKDVILKMLSRFTVKGGRGKIFEYGGEGIAGLTLQDRATIANMGAELGATTSLFPSDKQTLRFLKAQGREEEWEAWQSSEEAEYDETVTIHLDQLEPLIAKPHSPDNVAPVSEVAKDNISVQQVIIGSCTNSSYADLMKVAHVLKGKRVHPNVSVALAPGSKQVFEMIAQNGALADLIAAGVRVLESACGPCIGMGQVPATGSVSLRGFNRNFQGRSGSFDSYVYLSSPEVCAASALTGKITDPRTLDEVIHVDIPEQYIVNDNMIIFPEQGESRVQIARGNNIVPLPESSPLPADIRDEVILKVGDDITTDHISPINASIINKMAGNIPEAAKYCFYGLDPTFYERAKKLKTSIIVGGANYGQGSSREQSALIPSYLGVKAVIAKSFARIHHDNLINFGIVPLTFVSEDDYDDIDQGDELEIKYVYSSLVNEIDVLQVSNKTKNREFEVMYSMTQRQLKIVTNNGLLPYVKKHFVQGG